MKFSKVNFVQDINRPPEDPTPSSKENQKKQSGTNNMITTNNIALSGEKNILFIILIFCRLKTLLQKMEGNPNLSCSGPPSLIGPACFLRQIPKQLEEKKQTPLQSFPDWQKEQGLSFLGCPSSRCQLTSNRTLLPKVEMFDAIVFHQYNFDWEELPSARCCICSSPNIIRNSSGAPNRSMCSSPSRLQAIGKEVFPTESRS